MSPRASPAESRYMAPPLVRDDTIGPRECQREMGEDALTANTLVVLPTDSGKTVVAELVAVKLLHRHRGSKILFMAPTKPLVLQH